MIYKLQKDTLVKSQVVGYALTLCIGAGSAVDGQVLVMQDMLGMSNEFQPRFLRKYANLQEVVTAAVSHYIEDVKSVDFPNEKEQY